MSKQPSQILFFTGGILTIIASVAQLFDIKSAPWIFSAGAAIMIYLQFMNAFGKKDADVRQQRLARIGFTSSLLLALAAYFMFNSSNVWVVCVLIYALTSFFISFRAE
ncbi:MAG: hypothetical protein Q7U47_11925 [Paludibacter sp.]|nr:hypothetical protein [Paludibacter sp.]